MKKIIVAIDGYSSTGKSTVAKSLAKELNYIYVDTGAMYRAVSFYASSKGYIDKTSFAVEKLISELDQIILEFKYNPTVGYAEIYLNGKNVEKDIRSLEISNFVSKVAAVPEVRKKLVEQQQKIGLNKGVVMDGRDIGTVVFPKAELKIFMTASAEKRAKRRYKEMIDNGDDITYESVLDNVNSRDLLDTTRKDSPLVKADGAMVVDNSDLTVDETFAIVYQFAKEKLD